jgi:hypothetical protein
MIVTLLLLSLLGGLLALLPQTAAPRRQPEPEPSLFSWASSRRASAYDVHDRSSLSGRSLHWERWVQ